MSPTSDRDLPLPQDDLPSDFFTAERLQQDAHLFDEEIEDDQDAFFDMGPDPRERDFYLDLPADWLDVTKRVTYDIQFLPHRLRPRTPRSNQVPKFKKPWTLPKRQRMMSSLLILKMRNHPRLLTAMMKVLMRMMMMMMNTF